VSIESAPITADERWSPDELALLEALPPSLGGRIRALLRDRDHYLALHASLIDVERATSLDERLRIFVHAIHSIGYGRVGIAIREGDHEGPRCIAVGMEAHDVLALSDLRHGGAEWGVGGTHVLPLTTPAGHVVATLVLGDPAEEGQAVLARLRTIELFAQQVVHHVEQVRLSELTARQAERLQRLQVVGNAMARSLDEREISLEVARGVSQLIACDSVVVVHPDLERATVAPLVRLIGGAELPLPEAPLGDGVIARVARTGQPVLVAEPHPDASELIGADALVVAAGTPVGSLLAVPLRVGLHLVAVLAVASVRPDAFGDDDADLLLTMGAQAASALSNARLYAESQRERRQTEALADVARAVSESLRMGEVMRLIMRHAMSLLGAEGACVGLRRDDYLHIVAAGGSGDLLAGLMLPVKSSISGRAVLTHSPVITNDVPKDPDVSPQAQRLVRIRKTVIVPLSNARGVIGTLCVFNRGVDFDQDDARILQRLADHVAVAIVNARLYEELAESSREWTVAFNAIPTGMAVIDDDGRIVRYNARALQLGHFETHRELVGRQFYEAVLGDARPIGDGCPLSKALHDCVLGRATMRSETRGLLFEVMASPHPNGGAVVTFEDVTAARAQAEEDRARQEALTQSEARYTELVESASDAIFTVDVDGRFTSVNRALETATGRARDNLLGEHFSVVIDARDRDAMQRVLGDTLRGRRQRHELRYLDANGVSRPGAILTAPVIEGGNVVGLLGIVRDMSEEKLLIEQLVQQEKLAAIGQLVSGVAHELNNPLASVMAFSQLVLANPHDDAERDESLRTINAEAKRAAKIVSNLLTFARQHPPQRATTRVNEVISSVLEMRRYALAVHGVALDARLDAALPPIWADSFQLQQVILNLVGNAEQALSGWTGEKRIMVTSETRGSRIVITVNDSGPGIPAAEIDRVFNPFYTTKGIGKGTGLGLSVSDGIVREHGGSIRVESAGAGASFIIELPVTVPPGGEPADVVADPDVAASGSRPLSILVVDDERAIRSAIVRYFAGLGHTVDAAASGTEAYALLETRRYDVLLLDLRMPETGGDEIYQELVERDPFHAARVIFLTGDVQSDASRRFIEETGRTRVTKPFTFDELTRAVFAQGAR
jgi:PAS domain S-box-containing protein